MCRALLTINARHVARGFGTAGVVDVSLGPAAGGALRLGVLSGAAVLAAVVSPPTRDVSRAAAAYRRVPAP